MDEALAIEAMNLADGADIHYIKGVVEIYRSLARAERDTTDTERSLRSYVNCKRVQRQLRDGIESVRDSIERAKEVLTGGDDLTEPKDRSKIA